MPSCIRPSSIEGFSRLPSQSLLCGVLTFLESILSYGSMPNQTQSTRWHERNETQYFRLSIPAHGFRHERGVAALFIDDESFTLDQCSMKMACLMLHGDQ